MKNGWIKLHRKLLENPIIKKPVYLSIWIILLLKANHKENKIMWNGNVLKIIEGAFVTSRKELASLSSVPETTIEDILNFLERQHQIRQQKTTKFRLITIIEWEKYQNSDNNSDNKPTTSRQQADTNNNDKNENNEKKKKKKKKKNMVTSVTSGEAAGVKELMDIFYKFNPSLNWGNLTYKKAAAALVKDYGLDEAKEMAAAAISIQDQPYSPTVTNPWELREKLVKVKKFFDNQNNQTKILEV